MYKTIKLPLVLYGCETWSLTLREERRVRVFENSILRRKFGPKRDCSVNIVKASWAGHVERMEEGRSASSF